MNVINKAFDPLVHYLNTNHRIWRPCVRATLENNDSQRLPLFLPADFAEFGADFAVCDSQ